MLINIYHKYQSTKKVTVCFILAGTQVNNSTLKQFIKSAFYPKLYLESCGDNNYISISSKSLTKWCYTISRNNIKDPIENQTFWNQEVLENMIYKKDEIKNQYWDDRYSRYSNSNNSEISK